MQRKIFVILTLMLAGGCSAEAWNQLTSGYGYGASGLTTYSGREEVSLASRVVHDSFKGVAELSGPLSNGGRYQYLVRGWKHDGEEKWRFQVYVTATFSDWVFLDSAWSDGHALDVTQIDRDVVYCSSSVYSSGCTLRETIGVNFSEAAFRDKLDTGLSFKVTGKGGEFVVYVPPGYVQGVLDHTENWDGVNGNDQTIG